MPITKQDGVHKSYPISKYGLSGAHYVLLEGTSFPPERRNELHEKRIVKKDMSKMSIMKIYY